MKAIKEFIELVLKIAAEDMVDGSDYWPHGYFLLPDESVDIFLIDPNFMSTPRSKDALRDMMLKHLHERKAIYAVLVSDAWGAVAEMPKGSTASEARGALPSDLATYDGRTELLMAAVFGESMEPILAQWPYTRKEGKPVFRPGGPTYSDPSSQLSGRFFPDLSHGRKPA